MNYKDGDIFLWNNTHYGYILVEFKNSVLNNEYINFRLIKQLSPTKAFNLNGRGSWTLKITNYYFKDLKFIGSKNSNLNIINILYGNIKI